MGNKKVGKFDLSDFGALVDQQFFTVRVDDRFSAGVSQAAIARESRVSGVPGRRHPLGCKTFCNLRGRNPSLRHDTTVGACRL